MHKWLLVATCLLQATFLTAAASTMPGGRSIARSPATMTSASDQQYQQVIARTRSMVSDPVAQSLARRHQLEILDLTWEDAGRFKGSSVGPNISDITIQVQHFNPRTGQYELNLMPVIRHPNFSDQSTDISLDQLFLLVGNERGRPLQRVTLRQYLGDLRRYLHQPNSWQGSRTSLLAPRDSHALVSAQAAFLPIPKGSKAEFNPVLFNYQSVRKDPAVLAILVTREGSSATIIDNARDGFKAGPTWGQRLFFNKNGQRASLIGQRLSNFQSGPNSPAARREGLNKVLLIQVPLKQKRPVNNEVIAFSLPAAMMSSAQSKSNIESAVIGHGNGEGPFTEIGNLAIERDPNLPIRVTVQFYKATDNGVVSEADLIQIREQIDQVYAEGSYVGSLVVDGTTDRPTEYRGPKQQPPGWWDEFWRRHEADTGRSRQDALDLLRRLRGWVPVNPQELRQELQRIP